MPKIIKNVKEQLILEAKKQVDELGYANMTIRSVAKACNLAIGTVYNYFESKEMLVASFMLEDWQICLNEINKVLDKDFKSVLKVIYDNILIFANKYRSLFVDSVASKDASKSFNMRHKMLRAQLAKYIKPFIKIDEDKEFISNFIAESLICWSMEEIEFEKIYILVNKLI